MAVAPRKTNKQLVLFKLETTFNVDSTPTAVANAVLCTEPEYTPDITMIERPNIKPTWSKDAPIPGRKLSKMKFKAEIRSGGVAGTRCVLGGLLMACGMVETAEAGVKCTYKPSSNAADHKSATLYMYKDGLLHIMTGSFGTVQFEGAVNGLGVATFEFVGQYYPATDAPVPAAPAFETTKPRPIELAQFTIDGFAAVISKFSFDLGVEVLPRLDANGSDGYSGTYIGSRDIKGGIDPEVALVGDHNFWNKFSEALNMPLSIRVGAVAGNTVRFTAPAVSYTGLTYANRDQIQTFDAQLSFNDGGAGDDEFVIEIL